MGIDIVVSASCAMHTSDPMIAHLFMMLLDHVISPEAWVSWITYLSPNDTEAAGKLAVSCLGLPI